MTKWINLNNIEVVMNRLQLKLIIYKAEYRCKSSIENNFIDIKRKEKFHLDLGSYPCEILSTNFLSLLGKS